MKYLALFVIAALSHTGPVRSWWGYDHDYPVGNHHKFDYTSWCHSAGGWAGNKDNKDSWEDSSEDGQAWNDEDTWRRSSSTKRSAVITKIEPEGTSTASFRAGSIDSTPSPFDVLICLRECPITPEYNPVCGTDDITYWNPGRLQCAISCGIDVSFKRPSVCPTSNFETSTGSTSTTPSPQVLATCMRSCPVTSEYNPICGTDNITYSNPSRLECAKTCGKPVSLRLPSRCPSPDEMTASTMPANTSSSTSTASSVAPNNSGSRNSTVNTIAPDILAAIFNRDNSTKTTTELIPDFNLDERFENRFDRIV